MNKDTLQELFVELVRDTYDAEKQITKALPKLAKGAESEELAKALRNHLTETQTHVSRLEDVFKTLGVPARGKPCKGMKGLIEEGSEVLQEEDKGALRDLMIIAGAQKVEHYEMSAYATARTLADQLGLEDAVELLQQTEEEEKQADEKLTEVATALYESPEEEEGEEAGEEEQANTRKGASSGRSSSKPKTRKAGR